MTDVYTNSTAIVNRTFYKCYESGLYGTEGQGQHGVTGGAAKITVHSCIESTGIPITTVICELAYLLLLYQILERML